MWHQQVVCLCKNNKKRVQMITLSTDLCRFVKCCSQSAAKQKRFHKHFSQLKFVFFSLCLHCRAFMEHIWADLNKQKEKTTGNSVDQYYCILSIHLLQCLLRSYYKETHIAGCLENINKVCLKTPKIIYFCIKSVQCHTWLTQKKTLNS